MKTLCKSLIINILFIKSLSIYAQKAPRAYSVCISASADISSSDFRIEISRRKDFVNLRYGRLDSIQQVKLRADPDIRAYTNSLRNNSELSEETRRNLGSLFVAAVERHKVYKWDSLRIAATSAFSKLLDSVYTCSAAQLELQEENKNRIIVDGTDVYLTVLDKGNITKKVYAHSPRANSHPLLYRLLHESLQLYRQQRPAALLDLRYTNGY